MIEKVNELLGKLEFFVTNKTAKSIAVLAALVTVSTLAFIMHTRGHQFSGYFLIIANVIIAYFSGYMFGRDDVRLDHLDDSINKIETIINKLDELTKKN